jgi:predicted transposase/invertase (TIGR01784 family)
MLFLIRHAHKIEEPPEALTKGIFGEVLELAMISKFTQDELDQYEARMMTERDRVAALVSAEQRGEKKGLTKGKLEGKLAAMLDMAKAMLAKGYSLQEVLDLTHLPQRDVLALR